jgi:hypothetical protein
MLNFKLIGVHPIVVTGRLITCVAVKLEVLFASRKVFCFVYIYRKC